VVDQLGLRDILDLIFGGMPALMHMLRVVQTFALGNDDMCRFGRWKDARCESPKKPSADLESLCFDITSLTFRSATASRSATAIGRLEYPDVSSLPSDESTYGFAIFQYLIHHW
jgi:hypothetical protein